MVASPGRRAMHRPRVLRPTDSWSGSKLNGQQSRRPNSKVLAQNGSRRICRHKVGQMKPSKIISCVIALGVTTAMVPQASAQAPPPSPAPQQAPAPQQTQPQPQKSTQQKAKDKAKGAAAGAAIGAATGNAARGAVIGAGHSRREERRANRH